VLLSVFINLEENLQADRKDFVIRTEDLLVDKRSVGSIKVAGSFSTLQELDVLRAIVKEKRPELHPPSIPTPVQVTDPFPYLHTWSTLNIFLVTQMRVACYELMAVLSSGCRN